jgi:hypothetical protein
MPYTKLESQTVTYKTRDSWTKLDNLNAQWKSVGSVILGGKFGGQSKQSNLVIFLSDFG